MEDYMQTSKQDNLGSGAEGRLHTTAETELFAWIVAHLRQAPPEVLRSVFYFMHPFFRD